MNYVPILVQYLGALELIRSPGPGYNVLSDSGVAKDGDTRGGKSWCHPS